MNSDVFLVIFIIFLSLITIIPLLMRRFGIPGVIALLVVGMLVGPNCLNLVHRLAALLAPLLGSPEMVRIAENNFNAFITALGSLGLVFMMALAGMEADFKLIDSAKKPVIALSILTFLLPAVTGYFIYAVFMPDDFPGKLLYASLFASHSVGIVFPVIRELKLSKTKFGAAVLISTVVTDVGSIILLAVSVQLKKLEIGGAAASGSRTLSLLDYVDPSFFGNWFTPVFLLIVVVFLAVSVLLVHLLGRRFIKYFNDNVDMLITFLLLVILVTVLAGEFMGVNLIVGAFIAGLALSPLMREKGIGADVFFKFEGIGYGLLIPFLFISIGSQTDLRVFASPGNLKIMFATIVGLVASKMFSGWAAMRISGFDNTKGLCAGLMTVPQLSATLAAAAVGKSLGMLNDNFFNAIIALSIVTTIPIPSLVRFFINRSGSLFESTDEEAFAIPKQENDEDEIL